MCVKRKIYICLYGQNHVRKRNFVPVDTCLFLFVLVSDSAFSHPIKIDIMFSFLIEKRERERERKKEIETICWSNRTKNKLCLGPFLCVCVFNIFFIISWLLVTSAESAPSKYWMAEN